MSTTDEWLGDRDTTFHTKGAPGSIDGRRFYTLYNQKTGHTDIKEATWGGNVTDRYIGYYDKDGKFHWGGRSNDQNEVDFFKSKAGTKQALEASKNSSKRDLKVNQNKTEAEATAATNEIKNPNTATDTATDADVGTQNTAQIKEVNPGTKKDFGKGLTYPSTLDPKRQDTILFSMLEYSPKALTSSGGMLGSGNRADRKSIGSVILPIPNGIKDADKVEWGSDSMNAGELALAAIAFSVIAKGEANDELKKIQAGIRGVSGGDAKNAIASHFTGAAVGKDKGKFMSRATGQIMNPNMELLFTGPSLRDFSFTFLLAPRDHQEAMDVMRIIRFFKQGMLPIRSKSNLFLKAPHTFQLTYKTKDSNHPYLNSFKECALRSCDVNYTPENSYSTYTDSVMTAYSISLAFSELEPIYNDDYGKTTDFPASLLFESEQSSKTPGTTDYNPDSGHAPGYGPKDDEGTSTITGKPIDTSKGGSFI